MLLFYKMVYSNGFNYPSSEKSLLFQCRTLGETSVNVQEFLDAVCKYHALEDSALTLYNSSNQKILGKELESFQTIYSKHSSSEHPLVIVVGRELLIDSTLSQLLRSVLLYRLTKNITFKPAVVNYCVPNKNDAISTVPSSKVDIRER